MDGLRIHEAACVSMDGLRIHEAAKHSCLGVQGAETYGYLCVMLVSVITESICVSCWSLSVAQAYPQR